MNKGLIILGIGALIILMSNSKKKNQNQVYYGPGGNPNESNPNQQGIPFIKR